MENIAEIHDRVYQFLSEQYDKGNVPPFTLRQRNRAGRFDEGYWFTGNENYLSFSFWQGDDKSHKTSNIIFVITNDGRCSLEFVSFDEKDKIEFLSEVADVLEMQQKRRLNEEPYHHWVKNYKGTDYLNSLETFLRSHRKTIDSFVNGNKKGIEKVFAPIESKLFNTIKTRIDAERKKRQDKQFYEQEVKEIKTIKLSRLTVENVSLFGTEQTIEFHKNLTCLIGLNGTGKTSLLKALVLAFTGFEQNETLGIDEIQLLKSKIENILHIVGEKDGKAIYAKNGYAEIAYKIETNDDKNDETDYTNKVLFRNENSEVIISDDSNSDFKNIKDDKYKGLFIAVPQLQGEKKPSKLKDKKYPHIDDAISMLNGQPDNRFNAFSDWLRGLNNTANAKQSEGDSAIINEKVLINDIFKLMSEITGEEISLNKIVVTPDGKDPIWINIGKDSAPILLDLVSQGYNNIFSSIGNFLNRLVDVTPKGSDYKQTPAIVLIDEIDTYLHPKWQYEILNFLVMQFPNVQFIVTTHSPYVVGSIPNDKIKIYICEKDGFDAKIEEFDNSINLYGANIERLTRVLFHTPSRIGKIDTLINKVREAINNSEFDRAESLLNDIQKEKTSETDPEITSLKLLLRTKKRLTTA